ncbi:FAD-dependent oxidoreductase domain-containing protein 1-like [Danaus plexippus]|uniref:FAD-dependent oxidoreductase domain-containing protein 1-like n=1 Tax=Danaus plexippus TaxID=13037 RepID=UPI002AB2611F|nr:FAD-dependent oxidoreductase domain-containing protein 1-like [Danaus plexippus]
MASFSRTVFKTLKKNNILQYRTYVNPFTRTWNILSKEAKSGFKKNYDYDIEHTDIVVIGGGFIGSSVAYWLKTKAGEGLSVVVLDKDPIYKKSKKIYSHGVLSQHYSLLENIYLSQYSGEFLRNIKEHLVEGIDIQFYPHGYLTLASEKYANKLENNMSLLKESGINNKLLTVEEIQRAYPWIDTTGIKLGCVSTESEGIFDANALLNGFIVKSKQLGACYIQGEVVSFDIERQQDALMEGVPPGSYKKTNTLTYKAEDGQERNLKFAICIVAAGHESHNIARLLKIGLGDGLLQIGLPIEKREYNVYSIEETNNDVPADLNSPYVMDTSGLWLIKNGLRNNVMCGQIPSFLKDNDISVQEHMFRTSLTTRYPKLSKSKVKLLSKEIVDCNTYDDSGILGAHVYHNNLIFATGFGRQGVQHSPGIGRAVAELIIEGQYTTIDLTRFGFDRLLMDEPLIESNMY